MKYQILTGGPEPLTVLYRDPHVVCAAGFAPLAELAGRIQRSPDQLAAGDDRRLAEIWQRYLAGDFGALGEVVVEQSASQVQEAVWHELRALPPGRTVTYGQMAEMIGRPRAARAVGSACAANRIAPFIPCHRVVAESGALGGYAYGLPTKRWLLDHEAGVGSGTAARG